MQVPDTIGAGDVAELYTWKSPRARYVPVSVYADKEVRILPGHGRIWGRGPLHKLEARVEMAYADDYFPGATFMVFRVRRKEDKGLGLYALLCARFRETDGFLSAYACIPGHKDRHEYLTTWTQALQYIGNWRAKQ